MTDRADPSRRQVFLDELSQLYVHLSGLRACEKGCLREYFCRLCSLDFQSPSVILELLPLNKGSLGTSVAPTGGHHRAVQELATCITAILRDARHTPREVAVYCALSAALDLFLSHFSYAALLLALPCHGIFKCKAGHLEEGRGPTEVSHEDSIEFSLIEVLMQEAEELIERCSLEDEGIQGPSLHPEQQGFLTDRGLRQEDLPGFPSQYAKGTPLSEASAVLRTPSGDDSTAPSLDSEDSFQRPRPLKRRAPTGPQGLQGAPSANPCSRAPGALKPETQQPGGAGNIRAQEQREVPPEMLLLCCCPPLIRSGSSLAYRQQCAVTESLVLQYLLQLLLRLSRGLQLVQASLASMGGAPALGLHAFQSQLLHTWRPQGSSLAHEDSNNPTAKATALAVSVGDFCKALAAKVDSCWLFRELLRPPIMMGCIPGAPTGALAFLQDRQQVPGICEVMGSSFDGSGVGAPKEEGMWRELVLWKGPPRLDILRVRALELVAVLRQLTLHLPSAPSPLPSEFPPSLGGTLQQIGPPPQTGGPPMRRLLEAAAWLLSSEAVETLREAAFWLFGPLVNQLPKQPSCCHEMKKGMEPDVNIAASALQAAAVRAFAAGGGNPSDDEVLLSRTSPGVGWPGARDYTCLQDLVRLAWHLAQPSSSSAPLLSVSTPYGLPVSECTFDRGVPAPWKVPRTEEIEREDAEDQLYFKYGMEMMAKGLGTSLGDLPNAGCLYSSPDTQSDRVQRHPHQRKPEKNAYRFPCTQGSSDRRMRDQLVVSLQHQHIAEDCLEILARGWVPSESQRGHREELESDDRSPRPLPSPPLTTTALGPTFPVLLCTLEQMHAAGFPEDPGRDAAFLTSFFVKAKLQAATERVV